MTIATRWWWVSAAPIARSGVYVGQQDDAPIDVDASVYELLATILPTPMRIYSSPLSRALKPAEALGSITEIEEITSLEALNEQNFGDWEGKRFHEIQDIIEKKQAISGADIVHLKPENGESYVELISRAHLAIDNIHQELADEETEMVDILCVSHVSVIRAAIVKALGLNAEQSLKINLQPLSLTVLEHHEQLGWLVHTTGWTPWPMAQ